MKAGLSNSLSRKAISACLLLTVIWTAGSWMHSAYAQKAAETRKTAPKESFTRPKPTRPIRPTIPSTSRYQSDKVFLEQADSLFRRHESFGEEEHQIVKGNVKFRQGNMWMFCDSAYYYPELNSLDAFGHVRMEQGDTLFVYADKLFYDGDARFARLRCGPSEKTVRLINRNTRLTTDSLDYDLGMERGWYDRGGRLEDELNVLTSIIGEYSPATKEADFYRDVVLERASQGFRMLTDTLYYNTDTHLARIVSPTEIQSPGDTIITSAGWYNTESGNAVLTSRSTIVHRDSAENVTTLVGDSIVYDRERRISRAYMFRGPGKIPAPMVLTDTARRSILIGGYGEYDDSLRTALATDYPLLMEFSRPDTLFLRADTILTFIETRPVAVPDTTTSAEPSPEENLLAETDTKTETETESTPEEEAVLTEAGEPVTVPSDTLPAGNAPVEMKEFHVAKAFRRARFFNQTLQGVADSLVFIEADSTLYMYTRPVVWSGERQVYGNQINVHFNDSTADRAFLPDYGMMAEHVDEDFYNQLSGKQVTAWLENQTLKRLYIDGSVQTIFLPEDGDSTFNKLVYAESSFLNIDMDSTQLEKLKMWPEVSGTVTPIALVKRADMYLPGFSWYESIRPRREWYGDRLHWADDLGEIPDELEKYFSGAADTSTQSFRKSATKTSVPAAAPMPENLPAATVPEQEIPAAEERKEVEE